LPDLAQRLPDTQVHDRQDSGRTVTGTHGGDFPGEPEVPAALIRALATHPEQMAEVIAALHRPVHDADSLLQLMTALSRQAVRLLDGVGWAGVTVQFHEASPLTAAHTDARVLILDESQYAPGDGPCLEAMRTGRVVRSDLAEIYRRWPQLAVAAAAAGVNSVLAVPLRTDDSTVGALNLYSAQAPVPEPDPDVATVLAEYARRGLEQYRSSSLLADEQLRQVVAQWAVVEQAIGVLMQMHGFSPEYARDVLVDQARDWSRTVPEQAAQIISDN
jgi:GAF domain-containing protein